MRYPIMTLQRLADGDETEGENNAIDIEHGWIAECYS